MAKSDTEKLGRLDLPFGANEVRLSTGQWLAVMLIVAACFAVVPRLWKWVEPFAPAADYRLPYALSEDYWHYNRWTEQIAIAGQVPVVGDSVVWGEYVAPTDALSEQVNRQLVLPRLANAGLNGSHPLALEGLIRSYVVGRTSRQIVLHCNLLWMSSPERDLQLNREVNFNHARLTPQIVPRIPSYKATMDERIGNAVDRHLSFRGWVHHLRIAHFDGLDLPTWTLEHPYANVVSQVRREMPSPNLLPRHDEKAWFERGIEEQSFDWVTSQSSLQLAAFQRTVDWLQQREVSVFVIIGPFNEHLLADDNRNGYAHLERDVSDWLSARDVPHLVFPVLPSEEYGDASHPLAAGYLRLAEQLLAAEHFRDWLGT